MKRGELAKEMCGLNSILCGLIEEKVEMVNIMERMEQHMRKITDGLKAKSTQVKEVRQKCPVNVKIKH